MAVTRHDDHASEAALRSVLEREQLWLKAQESPLVQLETLGWTINETTWTESLRLPGGLDLEERWLAEGSTYRTTMAGIDSSQIENLRLLLHRNAKEGLILPMRHQLLTGHYRQKKSSGRAGAE